MTLPSTVKISRDESLCAVAITMTGDAESCTASGSGFLTESQGNFFLITNLHNLSGWDWDQKKALSAKGWVPRKVAIELCYVVEVIDQKTNAYVYRDIEFDLIDHGDYPLWYVHPTLFENVDVAALPLGTVHDIISRCAESTAMGTIPVNQHEWVNFSPAAGDDAMVLGFPFGMRGGSKFPVWKRASIAFEPDVDVDGLPKTMIDTATRQGMSGSLVLAVRRGFSMPDGGTFADSVFGESIRPLGVYSGRIGDDELGVQLGIVWKMSAVNEIVSGLIRGTSPFVKRISS